MVTPNDLQRGTRRPSMSACSRARSMWVSAACDEGQRVTIRPDDADRAYFERQAIGLLGALYGAALRLAKNRADAEDLVAEALAKAWENLASLQDRGCFRGWIFRILANTFMSERRKRGTESIEALTEGCAEDENEQPFSIFERLHRPFLLWWGNPEQDFVNKLLREDLEKALDALPEVFRVVVVLHDLEGFTYQEIAAMLDTPIGTVRSRLSRGRSSLQKTLWEQARDHGLAPAGAGTEIRPVGHARQDTVSDIKP